MSFIETRFPVDISYGAIGGPGYKTDVVVVNSGFEKRNITWQDARAVYDVSHGARTQAQLDSLIAFFRVMRGRATGFRFKDWSDFTVISGQGIFTEITATTFQMVRRYSSAGNNSDRIIKKPVSGSVTVTGGSGISINHATGIVTVTSGTPTEWIGEFDVPCRFDADEMRINIETYGTYSWGQILVVEVRV